MEQNHSLRRTIWNFLRPQPEELVAYIVVVFLLVGVAVYGVANNGSLGADSRDFITSAKSGIQQAITSVSSGNAWARVLLFGFWFIVGAAAYFIVWFLANLFIDVYNDIIISAAFVHPRSFHQSDYWASIVARIVLQGASAVALCFYVVFWVWVFAPIGIEVMSNILMMRNFIRIALNILLLLGGLALSLHLAVILLRLTLLKSHSS